MGWQENCSFYWGFARDLLVWESGICWGLIDWEGGETKEPRIADMELVLIGVLIGCMVVIPRFYSGHKSLLIVSNM